MFFYLVMLVYMGWVESVYPQRDRGLSDGAEAGRARREEAVPPKAEASDYPLQQGSSASSLNPLPEIPFFFRRFPDRQPSSIPVLEPDDTPLLADAYLRAGGGG